MIYFAWLACKASITSDVFDFFQSADSVAGFSYSILIAKWGYNVVTLHFVVKHMDMVMNTQIHTKDINSIIANVSSLWNHSLHI